MTLPITHNYDERKRTSAYTILVQCFRQRRTGTRHGGDRLYAPIGGNNSGGVATSRINLNRFGTVFTQNATYPVSLSGNDIPAGFSVNNNTVVSAGFAGNVPSLAGQSFTFYCVNNNGAVMLYLRWLGTHVNVGVNEEVILKWM